MFFDKKVNIACIHIIILSLLYQEMKERSSEDTKLTKQQLQETASTISSPPTRTIHIERHCAPSFRVLVRNLPLTLKTAQLRLFFSKHGKVLSAEVTHYKKTLLDLPGSL